MNGSDKMMKRFFIAIVVINTSTFSLYAQCPDSLAYFPSNVGDTWSYQIFNGSEGISSWYETHLIDSLYWVENYKYVHNSHQGWFRIDTTGCEVVMESPFGDWEFTMYQLLANVGDHWKFDSRWDTHYGGVRNIFSTEFFGIQTTVKEFVFFSTFDSVTSNPEDWENYIWTRREYLGKGFGLIFREFEPSPAWFLVGAIIDGDTLGTIIVSVSEPGVTLPEEYYLSQNYPNPFNPETTIKFTIPVRSHIKLVVYDMLGRIVDTLLDKEMDSGSYSVQWAPHDLSSGVYIYELRTEHYIFRKNLIYVK
jgi:hypothetical protein